MGRLILSPRSGRTKIAQRFIAGVGSIGLIEPAKRATDCRLNCLPPVVGFSRPFHGLGPISALFPALKYWANIGRPLRGLRGKRFVNNAG